MAVRRLRIAATVTATGGATQTFYSDYIGGGGLIEAIAWQRGTTAATTSGISTAAHVAFSAEHSKAPILDATATGDGVWYPRAYAVSTGNAAIGFSSLETSARIPVGIPVADERIKLIVSSGGTASNGGTRALIDIYVNVF